MGHVKRFAAGSAVMDDDGEPDDDDDDEVGEGCGESSGDSFSLLAAGAQAKNARAATVTREVRIMMVIPFTLEGVIAASSSP